MVIRNRIEVEGLEGVVHAHGFCEGQSCLVYAIHLYAGERMVTESYEPYLEMKVL